MVLWALVIVVVLFIPILAIVLDSQIGKAMAERLSRGQTPEDVQGRIEALEAEVRYLGASVEKLQEEAEFVRSLVEGPAGERDARRLASRPHEPGSPDSERPSSGG